MDTHTHADEEAAIAAEVQPLVEDDASPAFDRSIKHSRKRRQADPASATRSDSLSANCAATAVPSGDSNEPGAKLARSDASVAASAAAPAPSPFDDLSFGADDAAEAPAPRSRKLKAASTATAAAAAAALLASSSSPAAAASASSAENQTGAGSSSVDSLNRSPRTFLIHSPAYASLLDLQSVHLKRSMYFTSLLRSLRSDQWPTLSILAPRRATMAEMELFHSREYLTFFQSICTKYSRHAETGIVEQTQPISAAERADQERFGLIDDCAVFPEAFSMSQFICGGTLRAVECLLLSMSRRPLAPVTAVHWGGGRHHAESECAKGFCFCGDAVLACLQLLASDAIERVLYLDIDLHHGDGVERAFAASQSVMTVSLHHHAPGFFPTTGALDTEGDGAGAAKYSLLNLPLRAGIDDVSFCALFDAVVSVVLSSFRPSAVVVCAGVDGLASDRMSPFNLTSRAYAKCVHQLKKRLGHFAAAQQQADEEESKARAMAQAAEAQAKFHADSLYDEEEDSADEEGAATTASSSASAPVASAATADEKTAPVAAAASASSYPSSPIPLLLLGGGGYCPTDSARAFVAMTAAACSAPLPASLPDSEPLLTHYLPNLQMHSQAKPAASRPNENDRDYLAKLVQHARITCAKRDRMVQQEELAMEQA